MVYRLLLHVVYLLFLVSPLLLSFLDLKKDLKNYYHSYMLMVYGRRIERNPGQAVLADVESAQVVVVGRHHGSRLVAVPQRHS